MGMQRTCEYELQLVENWCAVLCASNAGDSNGDDNFQ